MKITQVTHDTYEVVTNSGLRHIVVTGARLVVQRTGRAGAFVQRLVGFVDATTTRFAVTLRRLTNREIQSLLPCLPIERGIGERLLSRVMRRLGARQTLALLVGLAGELALAGGIA